MPKPKKDETRKDFISRCIPIVLDDETAESQEQAVAICNSIWRRKDNRASADSDMSSLTQRYVRLTGLANGAELRVATFEDREHIVVPVIALIGNSIIRPMHSEGPEFVPAEEIATAPKGWNGRPVVPDHPGNGRQSANDPETLESFSFGRVFNTKYEDGKLKMEAWLDPLRAEKVGPDAIRVIERCKAGEMVEVSTGVWVAIDKVSGTYNGENYTAIWHDPIPDHLAMLPEGAKGACSVDMGCGGPRVNRQVAMLSVNINKEKVMAVAREKSKSPNLLQRLLAQFKFSQDDDGVSDRELRDKLHAALRAVEPGFDWIVDVFPDSSTVIYTTWPENELLWFKRTFTVAESGEVTLNDDREQVEPITRYEPIAAAEANGASSVAASEGPVKCQCQPSEKEKGVTPMSVSQKVKETVTRILASKSKRNLFTEDDRAYLEGLKEERLKALEDGLEEPEEEPKKVDDGDGEETPKTPAPTPSPTSSSDAELAQLRSEVEALRPLAVAYTKHVEARKSQLVSVLKGAQKVHTEAALKALSVERLEEIAALIGANENSTLVANASYIGNPLPIEREAPELPDTYGLRAMEEKRKAASGAIGKEVN
jgi:hypothetical protein